MANSVWLKGPVINSREGGGASEVLPLQNDRGRGGKKVQPCWGRGTQKVLR